MYTLEELRSQIISLKRKYKFGLTSSIQDQDNLIKVLDEMLNFLESNKPIEDVTAEYENTIHSFECDFAIAFNYGDFQIFDDLKRLYESKNKRLLEDIEKLQELCFNLRYKKYKIYKIE